MRYLPLSIVVALCLHSAGCYGESNVSIMPRDLIDFGLDRGCGQVDDFYERPGMRDPVFVRGRIGSYDTNIDNLGA